MANYKQKIDKLKKKEQVISTQDKIISLIIVGVFILLFGYILYQGSIIRDRDELIQNKTDYIEHLREINNNLKHDNELILTGYSLQCDVIQEIEEFRIISDDGLRYEYELQPRIEVIR